MIITDKIDIAVESSAAQSTYQPFRSVNTSNSSITFNVNVPSENIAIDRRILIQTDLNLKLILLVIQLLMMLYFNGDELMDWDNFL